jgi:hypothetical protein
LFKNILIENPLKKENNKYKNGEFLFLLQKPLSEIDLSNGREQPIKLFGNPPNVFQS